MLAIAFILTVVAFADPVISVQEKVYTSLGNDVIFVVDTSPSMAAKDIDGDRRIDSAKNAIKPKPKAPKVITVKCPRCGAELKGEKGSEVTCSYCDAVVPIK